MSGEGRVKRVLITRPANTTAYATDDAIGDVGGSAIIEFPGLVFPGTAFLVMSATLEYHVAAIPTSAAFRLELYNAAPAAIADNAAWSLIAGDRGKHVGTITFDTIVDRVDTLKIDMDKINKLVKAGSSQSLWGILVAAAGFTPAGNSEVLAVTLGGAPL